MMRCVTTAMPIQFINGNKLKSCRLGLTNHTQPISCHWLLTHSGTDTQTDRQTDRQTDTHTHTHTHTLMHEQNDFKKPGIGHVCLD